MSFRNVELVPGPANCVRFIALRSTRNQTLRRTVFFTSNCQALILFFQDSTNYTPSFYRAWDENTMETVMGTIMVHIQAPGTCRQYVRCDRICG